MLPRRLISAFVIHSPKSIIDKLDILKPKSFVCVKQNLCKTATLKKTKFGFQDQLWLNSAGQKYCRMLQGEHSAVLSTFITLPFVIKIFVLSIFERPFYTGFTVHGKF